MKLISTNTTATGPSVDVHNRRGLDFIAVSTHATVTATTLIEGSMGKDNAGNAMDWILFATLADSAGDTVAWFPHMRARVTANAGVLDADIAGN